MRLSNIPGTCGKQAHLGRYAYTIDTLFRHRRSPPHSVQNWERCSPCSDGPAHFFRAKSEKSERPPFFCVQLGKSIYLFLSLEAYRGPIVLNAYVLVLNKSWVAVNVAPARRALRLLVQGRARVVHPHDYGLYDFSSWLEFSRSVDGLPPQRYIYTSSDRIRLPEVIVLNAFNGFYSPEVRLSRRNIFARDKDVCQYCGDHFPRTHLTIDHILPRSRGGSDTWDNLVLACAACNLKKRDRTPEEAHMPLIRKPLAPRWLPRFSSPLPREELRSWKRFVDLAYWGAGEADA